MIIDKSAVLAILQREPRHRRYPEAIEAADAIRMSVASFVEGSMVIESRYGTEGLRDLTDSSSAPPSAASERDVIAPGLNYGDCFSYAAAIGLGEPLLCQGDDFIHTDAPICDIH
jgi:ribonuclease VapC